MKLKYHSALRGITMVLGLSASPAWSTIILSENFDNIATLPGAGWNTQNLSDSAFDDWFQGNTVVFASHSGAADSYIASNFQAGFPTINHWLLTPNVTLNNGFVLTFYAQALGEGFPDRLEVRLSTNGASTNVGNTSTSVGDFTTVLLDLNPVNTGWNLHTITFSGLAGPTSGRIGFRYTIADANIAGNYVGIDTLALSDGATIPEPATIFLSGALLSALAFIRKSKP